MTKVNGKLQLKSDRIINSPGPSEMTVWVAPSNEESQPPEVLAEDKGNTEWIVGEGVHDTNCDDVASYSNSLLFCYNYVCVGVSWRVFFKEIDILRGRVKQIALICSSIMQVALIQSVKILNKT